MIAVVRPRGRLDEGCETSVPYIPPAQSRDGEPDANDPGSDPVNVSYELLAAPRRACSPAPISIIRLLIPAGADIVPCGGATPNARFRCRSNPGSRQLKGPPAVLPAGPTMHWGDPPAIPLRGMAH